MVNRAGSDIRLGRRILEAERVIEPFKNCLELDSLAPANDCGRERRWSPFPAFTQDKAISIYQLAIPGSSPRETTSRGRSLETPISPRNAGEDSTSRIHGFRKANRGLWRIAVDPSGGARIPVSVGVQHDASNLNKTAGTGYHPMPARTDQPIIHMGQAIPNLEPSSQRRNFFYSKGDRAALWVIGARSSIRKREAPRIETTQRQWRRALATLAGFRSRPLRK